MVPLVEILSFLQLHRPVAAAGRQVVGKQVETVGLAAVEPGQALQAVLGQQVVIMADQGLQVPVLAFHQQAAAEELVLLVEMLQMAQAVTVVMVSRRQSAGQASHIQAAEAEMAIRQAQKEQEGLEAEGRQVTGLARMVQPIPAAVVVVAQALAVLEGLV